LVENVVEIDPDTVLTRLIQKNAAAKVEDRIVPVAQAPDAADCVVKVAHVLQIGAQAERKRGGMVIEPQLEQRLGDAIELLRRAALPCVGVGEIRSGGECALPGKKGARNVAIAIVSRDRAAKPVFPGAPR
jgi:hypothetical protein